ncbi:DExH-box ATP-dependent RNA helicase DExH8 isoform X2 [Cynara cardunculus var. scolymus]|uniref:DExH-box ATP-dependent RNA helicase DExH8 isoform X2 n=1 Tax=Cynara cardunculus var. scolymus TaxID=59895 RepID=UPI000D626C31|nr:DExH-box ATP-dependent RNA helicase DExH8 isoform X2 [Cynara cardunculus var. scolymus]
MPGPSTSLASQSSSPPSSSPSSENFRDLPIMSLRSKIVEKIMENRVTLIVGETGCGKSSQVPQFLLEENIEPILCTQPRRFAVVAVAKMVAKARNCIAGGEVGYHIGHSKVMSASSKIIFKTAGVLLEELREKGMNALKYKVIILDEVHERSVESDLVLVCVKQFLIKNSGLRVVLMSATADITRYKEYFRDLGRGERVEVLGIPSSDQHTLYQRRVSYLEQVVELLDMSSESLSIKYCSGPSPSSEAVMNDEVHKLIHNLVLHIHKNETDMEKSILIFLPTYFALEQQWHALSRFSSDFRIHILHSSIDTEQALNAMRILKTHRKVILATNIAESSVTIPKVAYVIDSCRSLQVYWDANRKIESSEIVWVSESQAEQRRGRTGRTCDGEVYRLVTESFFGQLEKYETPSILKLSLRQQVLLTTCAESKAINDPKVLLQKVMDPPRSSVVDDALDLLVHIRALERTSPRGRFEPTFYGRLLSSFALSFDASMLILKFGEEGMLREGIIIGILMDTQPLPIVRPFGQEALFSKFINNYYNEDSKITGLMGRKEVIFMANFCAYQFWQRTFQDNLRLERLKHVLKFDETTDTQIVSLKIQEEWCSFHHLVQSSLQHIASIYESILHSVHRYRPTFLATSSGLPTYYTPYEFQHKCLIMVEDSEDEDSDTLATDNDLINPINGTKKCTTLPFVGADGFNKKEVAFRLARAIKEIRMRYLEDVSGSQQIFNTYDAAEASVCVYFVNGTCNKGSQCAFSHSLDARKPVCKFFLSLQGCRNGNSCFFSHSSSQVSLPRSGQGLCVAEDVPADASLLLSLFPNPENGCILIFDDFDLQFSSNFAKIYNPSSIVCTTAAVKSSIDPYLLQDISVVCELSHPDETIISKSAKNTIPWNEVKCAVWIPKLGNDLENREEQKGLIKTFFEYLAIRILGDTLYEVQVILVMNNLHFAQLQVENLARENFFYLMESFAFDEYSFGKVYGKMSSRAMQASKPIVYAFELHPPTDIQFGDYTSVLHKQLHE